MLGEEFAQFVATLGRITPILQALGEPVARAASVVRRGEDDSAAVRTGVQSIEAGEQGLV